MDEIDNFLKMLAKVQPPPKGFKHGSYADLLLSAGTSAVISPPPDDPSFQVGIAGGCYGNAGQLALLPVSDLSRSRYQYVEGYAFKSDLPIPLAHAWVRDRQTGLFHDPTWSVDDGLEIIGRGIVWRTDFLREWVFKHEYWGIFGSDEWEQLSLILRHGVDADSVATLTPELSFL